MPSLLKIFSHVYNKATQITGHKRYLQEHGANKEDAFHQLDVDVHVIGYLALLVEWVWLLSTVVWAKTLSQHLLSPLRIVYVIERGVRLLDHPLTKSAQSQLADGPVIENLQQTMNYSQYWTLS